MSKHWPQLNTYESGSKLTLISSGHHYFEILCDLIQAAKEVIHFQVYILDPDETGQMVLNALKAAAARGVKVYLVVDAYGSHHLNEELLTEIKDSGIWVRRFGPIHFNQFRVGRRLHHKVIVVDSKKGLVSGINISDKYYGRTEAPWLDFGLLVEGPLCLKLEKICSDIRNKKLALGKPLRKSRQHRQNEILARVLVNDLLRQRRGIIRSYKASFRAAKKEIVIVAGYFLPGYFLRMILKKASQRGVKITILVSKISDVLVAGRATTYLYDWLIRLNAEIYEYKPSVVHGKISIVDDYWMTVGSYNLNDLSEYASVETNIDCISPELAMESKRMILDFAVKDCDKITSDTLKTKAGIFSRFLNFLSYILVGASFRLFFFLTKNDRQNRLE